MTPTGARKHLDSLLEEGLVAAGSRAAFGPAPDRRRGRPARVYSLTKAGRRALDQGHEDLATAVLRFMAERGGPDEVAAFAEARALDIERRYSGEVAVRATTRERTELLAAALTRDGFAASVVPGTGAGVQICQHNCPVVDVAEEFPQLCEQETEALGRLLGAHVTRLATIARGDGVCTTLVSETSASDLLPRARRESVTT